MAARDSTEVGLIRSVMFIAMTTYSTGTRRVARVNVDHTHARKLRLVADKRAQLPKSPGMAHTTLLASNRDSLADLYQILQSECLTLRLRLSHQRLADAVIHIFLKAMLAPGILAQPPTSTAALFDLQPAAVVVSLLPNCLNLLAAVRLAIRVGSKIHDAQVNAQVADWLIRSGRDLRLRDAQIPHSV